MNPFERIPIYALLIAILILTALTYRHVTGQQQEMEARIEYLSDKIDNKINYRRQETKRFADEWRENGGG